MIHWWMCVECSTCLIPVWQSLEQLTKLWQEIRVCAYLSTHVRFTFTLYTMNSTQENHLSQFVLDCNKTHMSVRWNEPTAGGMSWILLQQNRQKENLWNQMCGINRGCLNIFLFYDGKKGCFSSEYSWRMWYVTHGPHRTTEHQNNPLIRPYILPIHSLVPIYMLSTPQSINLQSIQFILVRVNFKLQPSCCY